MKQLLYLANVFLFGLASIGAAEDGVAARPSSAPDGAALKAGLYVHFGLPTFANRGESASAALKRFGEGPIDVASWPKAAKQAGLTFAVLTAKHEAGLCLWRSKNSDYDLTQTPCQGDLIAEFIRACEAEGILPGLHYSIPDEHLEGPKPKGPVGDLYFETIKKHLAELHALYPKVRVQLFDVSKRLTTVQFEELRALVQQLNPGCVVLDEKLAPRYSAATTLRAWMWSPTPKLIPFDQIATQSTTARDLNRGLLLNVGPDRSGRIPDDQMALLLKLRDSVH